MAGVLAGGMLLAAGRSQMEAGAKGSMGRRLMVREGKESGRLVTSARVMEKVGRLSGSKTKRDEANVTTRCDVPTKKGGWRSGQLLG